jgi:hypothetical protein
MRSFFVVLLEPLLGLLSDLAQVSKHKPIEHRALLRASKNLTMQELLSSERGEVHQLI